MRLKKSSNSTEPCDRLLQEPITFPRKMSRTFHEFYQKLTAIRHDKIVHADRATRTLNRLRSTNDHNLNNRGINHVQDATYHRLIGSGEGL